MRKTILLTFVAIVAASCINENYDLDKVKDTNLNISPEVTMEIEESTSAGASQLFGMDSTQFEVTPTGDIIIPIVKEETYEASEAVLMSEGLNVAETGIEVSKDDLPQILANSAIKLHLRVFNPTDSKVILKATLDNDNGSCTTTGMELLPGDNDLNIENFIEDKTFLRTSTLSVTGLNFTKNAATKALALESDETVVFNISAYVPAEMEPEATFDRDIILEQKSIDKLSKFLTENGIDAKEFTVTGKVLNGTPLALTASMSVKYSDGTTGTVALSPEVESGYTDAPAETSIEIKSSLPNGLENIVEATIRIHGRVPAGKYEGNVSINQNQTLSVTLEQIDIKTDIQLGL